MALQLAYGGMKAASMPLMAWRNRNNGEGILRWQLANVKAT